MLPAIHHGSGMDDRSALGCIRKSSEARQMGTRRLNDIPRCSRVRREQGKTKKEGGGRRPGSRQRCQNPGRCAACRNNHTRRARTRSDWWAHQLSSEWTFSAVAQERVDVAPYPQKVGGRAVEERRWNHQPIKRRKPAHVTRSMCSDDVQQHRGAVISTAKHSAGSQHHSGASAAGAPVCAMPSHTTDSSGCSAPRHDNVSGRHGRRGRVEAHRALRPLLLIGNS